MNKKVNYRRLLHLEGVVNVWQFLIFIFIVNAQTLTAQTALEKTVSLNVKNIPITEALLTLSETAKVNITFSPDFFPKNKTIHATATEEKLKVVLANWLKDTRIGFKINNGGIILFRKAPRRFTLSGYLTDAETEERLVGANMIELGSLEGGTSNAYGFYSHSFKEGKIQLQVSYLGYQTEIITINLSQPKTINIALKPSLTLQEIVVVSEEDSLENNFLEPQKVLPLDRLSRLPAAGGESDVIRYLQLLPGVNNGADGFGGLHVRGGNSDQNLVLMDDVTIYNPSHTFGLFSIFNTDLVKSVQFYKGGFPARYDSRISSVLDIRMKEGNVKKFSGTFTAGTMATKLLLEIPLPKEKGGILIAGRRSHINAWLGPYSEDKKPTNATGRMQYQFNDLNIKAHYSLGKKDKLYASYYSGNDNFSDHETVGEVIQEGNNPPTLVAFLNYQKNTYQVDWGNQIFSLRWNHLFNDKIFANTTATYSNFKYQSEREYDVQVTFQGLDFLAFKNNNLYSSEIEALTLRSDVDYFLNHQHRMRFGVNAIYRNFVPSLSESRFRGTNLDSIGTTATTQEDQIISTNEGRRVAEFNAYAEEEFKWKNWIFNSGVRLTTNAIAGNVDFVAQPRFLASYTLNPNLIFKTSMGRSVQYLHLLTRSDAGLPNDLWVPAGENTSPQKAWQWTLGAGGRLFSNSTWEIEGYWKKLNNLYHLVEDKEEPNTSPNPFPASTELNIDANNWEDHVIKGSGEAVGVEVTVEQHKGRWTGWLSYTFARSIRNFANRTEAFRFDSRHGLTVASTFRIKKNIDLSLSWIYQSGLPYIPDDFTENDIPFASLLEEADQSVFEDRLPAYHRLDAGVNIYFGKKRLQHKVQLGVYNAYNQKNIFFTYQTLNPNTGQSVPQSVNGLPILPSINYSVKW